MISPSWPYTPFQLPEVKESTEVRTAEGVGAAPLETETGMLAVVLSPRLSVTMAEIVWVPFDTSGLAQCEVKTGPAPVTAAPTFVPSIWN